MSRKRSALIAVFVIATLGVAAWLAQGPREPTYPGKPLSTWLKKMERWDGDTNATFVVCPLRMGTNAAPALPVLTNLLFHSNALITSTVALPDR